MEKIVVYLCLLAARWMELEAVLVLLFNCTSASTRAKTTTTTLRYNDGYYEMMKLDRRKTKKHNYGNACMACIPHPMLLEY